MVMNLMFVIERRSYMNALIYMQFSKLPTDNFVPQAMAFDWLARKLYIAGSDGGGGSFEVWSIVDVNGVGGVMSLLYSASEEVEQAQMTVNPFSG